MTTKIVRPGTYTPFQVEAAICVFEWLMDRAQEEPWKEMFDGAGWAQMRLSAIDTAVWVDKVCEGLEFDVAHDWEIVPWLLRRLDWDRWLEGTAYGGEDPFPPVGVTRAYLIHNFPGTKVSP